MKLEFHSSDEHH
jgi:alpha-glucan,water dikinase